MVCNINLSEKEKWGKNNTNRTVHTERSKVEILQNFVAFSEYMNINKIPIISHILFQATSWGQMEAMVTMLTAD